MKKTLLSASLMLLACASMSAAAPEGNIYLLGMNGDSTPSETNLLQPQERSADDIDEGVWRWAIPSLGITVENGTFTIGDGASFSLGFDADNEFGFTNAMSATQSMIYLAEGGEAVNYSFAPGEYSLNLILFEDIDGDMGGDSWIVQITSEGGSQDESYYLVGFNETTGAEGGHNFMREEYEEDGETYYMYTLTKYYVGDCPDGFTVYDAGAGVSYGLSADFAALAPEVTEESPYAFMAPDGENVKCSLPAGYYDVTFSATGAVAMISFMLCEDQTPVDELTYYLTGLNGVAAADAAYKFERTVEEGSFVDDESGETVEYKIVEYSLNDIQLDSCEDGLKIVSENGEIQFGFNDSMAAVFANDLSADMPFAVLAANGSALNCSLPAGKYNFSFTLTSERSGMLSVLPAGDDAVEEISVENENPVYYDLSGRRVAQPEKGIYIEKRGSKVSKIAK